MEKLPKIALHRLRQRSTGRDREGVSPSGNAPETNHPGPDLLTAFAEQRLSKNERSQVTRHLAECAECREVVALATLAKPEVEPLDREARKAPRLLWPVWGWRVAVVGVSTAVICFALYRAVPPGLHKTTVAERKLAPRPTTRLQTTQAGEGASAESAKPQAAPMKPAQEGQPLPALSKAEPAEGRPSTAPTNLGIANIPKEVKDEAPSAAPPEARRIDNAASAPIASSRTVKAGQPAEAAPVPKKEEAVEVSGGPVVSSQAMDASKPAQPRDASGIGSALRPAGVAGGQPESLKTNALSRSGAQFKAKRSGLAARWSISAVGKIERSTEGGTTWEELHVNDSLVFRVVTAAGSEVWAGGARGALYHSVDGGEHWTRVYLEPDRAGPEDAIVGIDFPDPVHGRVTTAADERWITSDGGRHWTRE